MRISSLRGLLALFLSAVTIAFTQSALAEGFPSRQVTIVVPFDPGAATDIAARILAQKLATYWGVRVVVENRSGAASTIGARFVSDANPDGYTLLFSTSDTFATVPFLKPYRSFRPKEGLVPIHLIADVIDGIVVHPSLHVTTLPELVAYARANPTELRYSSAGAGSAPHLAIEMLKSVAKIDIQHVPYRGLAQAVNAVMTDQVQISAMGYSGRSLVDSGMLRMIAVAGPKRFPAFPNVPTTAEVGYPKVIASTVLNVAAPAKTPRDVLEKIDSGISRAMNDPEVKQLLTEKYGLLISDIGLNAASGEIERLSKIGEEMVHISGADKE